MKHDFFSDGSKTPLRLEHWWRRQRVTGKISPWMRKKHFIDTGNFYDFCFIFVKKNCDEILLRMLCTQYCQCSNSSLTLSCLPFSLVFEVFTLVPTGTVRLPQILNFNELTTLVGLCCYLVLCNKKTTHCMTLDLLNDIVVQQPTFLEV